MSVARLRGSLPDGVLPDAEAGVYRLTWPSRYIDIWRLHDLVSPGGRLFDDGEIVHLLDPVEPYRGVEENPFLDQSRLEVRHSQRRLLSRVVRERPGLLPSLPAGTVAWHLAADPYEPALVEAAVQHRALSGDRRAALALLGRARRRFGRSGLELGPELDDLERRLLGTMGTPRRSGGVPAPVAPMAGGKSSGQLPRVLADLRSRPYVGDASLVDRLQQLLLPGGSAHSVLISGERGTGKSRLCAELAALATGHSAELLHLTSTPASGSVAFGSLLSAVPAFRDRAEKILREPLTAPARRHRLRAAARRVLLGETTGALSLVVADDCQWLDDETRHLLVELAGIQGGGRLVIVAAGTPERSGPCRLQLFHRALQSVGPHHRIELTPFDMRGMAAFVRSRRPELTDPVVRQVSDRVLIASKGVPAFAETVLDGLDELNLIPEPRSLPPGSALEAVVRSLPDQARRVGAVGAVVGPAFESGPVAGVLHLSVAEVTAAITHLVEARLVVERPDRGYLVANVLAEAALTRAALRHHLARWHLAAVTLAGDDVHRRARHLAEATPLVTPEDAVLGLLESGGLHLSQGRADLAARQYQRASTLNGGELPPEHHDHFSQALLLSERKGATGRERRTGASTTGHRSDGNEGADALPNAS